MTREPTVVEQFEQGTLLEVRPHSMYADQGYVHAYYVPDEARQSTGMEKVAQMDSPKEFFKENGAPDFKAIQDHVSAAEIAEQAEILRERGRQPLMEAARRDRLIGCRVVAASKSSECSALKAARDRVLVVVLAYTAIRVGKLLCDPDDPRGRGVCWGK